MFFQSLLKLDDKFVKLLWKCKDRTRSNSYWRLFP